MKTGLFRLQVNFVMYDRINFCRRNFNGSLLASHSKLFMSVLKRTIERGIPVWVDCIYLFYVRLFGCGISY